MKHDDLKKLLIGYGCGPVKFIGTDEALFERRLVLEQIIDPGEAGPREQLEALAGAMRDVLAQRWLKTAQSYDRANPKQVYYLSMEFLIGRTLSNNVTRLERRRFQGRFCKYAKSIPECLSRDMGYRAASKR